MQDYQKQFVMSLLAYAAQRDISVERLCQLSSIDYGGLNEGARVDLTAKQVADLWLDATHLSHDPLFGLHFGESLQVAALGVVGELVRNSRAVGEALKHAAAFTHLITDAMEMRISRTDRTFTIQFIPDESQRRASPLVFNQLMDFFMAFALHEVDGLVLKKLRPNQVTIPYSPADLPDYKRVLRCDCIQQADAYAVTFDNDYWNVPILLANYELQNLLLQKVSALERAFGVTQKVSERISDYLLANANFGIPSLEAMAANFNTSPRSLQRKLQEEGLTYQQVSDSIRKSLAVYFLEAGHHPLKEISYRLGYNELSAFNRAFKRWTGTTPGVYQKGKQT